MEGDKCGGILNDRPSIFIIPPPPPMLFRGVSAGYLHSVRYDFDACIGVNWLVRALQTNSSEGRHEWRHEWKHQHETVYVVIPIIFLFPSSSCPKKQLRAVCENICLVCIMNQYPVQ